MRDLFPILMTVVLSTALTVAGIWTVSNASAGPVADPALQEMTRQRDLYRERMTNCENILKNIVLKLGTEGEAPVVSALNVPLVRVNRTAGLGLSTSVWPEAEYLVIRVTK